MCQLDAHDYYHAFQLQILLIYRFFVDIRREIHKNVAFRAVLSGSVPQFCVQLAIFIANCFSDTCLYVINSYWCFSLIGRLLTA